MLLSQQWGLVVLFSRNFNSIDDLNRTRLTLGLIYAKFDSVFVIAVGGSTGFFARISKLGKAWNNLQLSSGVLNSLQVEHDSNGSDRNWFIHRKTFIPFSFKFIAYFFTGDTLPNPGKILHSCSPCSSTGEEDSEGKRTLKKSFCICFWSKLKFSKIYFSVTLELRLPRIKDLNEE